MFPTVLGPLMIDLGELIRKLVEALVRQGRLLGKSSGFNTNGDLVDEESYELEATRVIRRGVLCYEVKTLQIWTITTITQQPSGKVIQKPTPKLVKESIVSERQVECPPENAPQDNSAEAAVKAMLSAV